MNSFLRYLKKKRCTEICKHTYNRQQVQPSRLQGSAPDIQHVLRVLSCTPLCDRQHKWLNETCWEVFSCVFWNPVMAHTNYVQKCVRKLLISVGVRFASLLATLSISATTLLGHRLRVCWPKPSLRLIHRGWISWQNTDETVKLDYIVRSLTQLKAGSQKTEKKLSMLKRWELTILSRSSWDWLPAVSDMKRI